MATESHRGGEARLTVLFSVIIPVFNRAALLGETLRSVMAQEYTDFEVIVVDDGSTDHSVAVARAFGDRVTVLRQNNLGAAAARNVAAAGAVGDYLVFLDSDDLWSPWTLAVYWRAIQQYGRVSMLHASWVEFSGAEAPARSRSSDRAVLYRDYFHAGSDGGVYVAAGRLAVRRDHFLSSGGFDESLRCAEDHDLVLRLGEQHGFVAIGAPCQVAYRRHTNALTGDIASTVSGVGAIIKRERSAQYGGTGARRKARREIIGRIVRPVSIAALRAGRWREAMWLYWSILPWMVRMQRWRYMFGVPVVAIREALPSAAHAAVGRLVARGLLR